MNNLRGLVVRLLKNEDGATMIEYSILIGIITALVIGLVVALGGFVQNAWSDLCSNISSASGASGMITCP